MRRAVLFLVAALVALTISAPAMAGEWVQFPATVAWCEYYGSQYWCWSVDGYWFMANPNWMYAPAGG